MSLKHFTVAALLAACTFVPHASAQKNELSGLLGRTFISDQGIKGVAFFDNNIHFGSGLTFEANYARRVLGPGVASISLRSPSCSTGTRKYGLIPSWYPQSLKFYF